QPDNVPPVTDAQAKLAFHCKLGKGPLPNGNCAQALSALGAHEAAAGLRRQELERLLAYSLVALGVMTVVSGGLGWVMAGRVLRPVSSITAAARRASEQHLGERLALCGPHDELRELADTFDQMLERLDAAFATQRRFVADASHELRTPLTVMRTAIEVTMAKPARTPEQLEAMAAKVARSAAPAAAMIEALLTPAAGGPAASWRRAVRNWCTSPRRRRMRRSRPWPAPASLTCAWTPPWRPRRSAETGCCWSAWSATWWTTRCGTIFAAAGYSSAPGPASG